MNFDGRQEGWKTAKALQLTPRVSLVVNGTIAFLQGISGLRYVKVVEMSSY